MSKFFEVEVSIWKTVLVEVEDSENRDHARQAAYDEYLRGKNGEISDITDVTEEQLHAAQLRADEILSL